MSKRRIALLMVYIATVVFIGVHTANVNSETGAPVNAPVATCEEDEPCWDCRTMGNHLCSDPNENVPSTN